MVSSGRALIADPDWPKKVRAGEETLPYSRAMLGELA